ncbi:endonuclease/exonuclease/phosphatase family protein [Pseudorhodobacter sp.]|uniref:endonuclease/exonuclease/phosphatase family protein n=1 Tax=Pseudorhodobacter sp. TaxID=1934400 RepID=UPI002649FD5F|nr:endonuclease/exonuclease/phosphatase family protein [Pseudorhodobacter sp.]MDN5786050.1 endonuclease [Pseudorhodobacter sp.]
MANARLDPPALRENLRLATYNVEWFNTLFNDAGELLWDAEPSARYDISRAEQIAALGVVFTALDADGVMVVEAPDTGSHRSTITALETFARHFGLRARKAVMGFVSETEQEIAFLFDPDRLQAVHAPMGPAPDEKSKPGVARFDGTFRYDLNVDAHPESIRFSKPPLELAVRDLRSGQTLRLIGVHAKSKAPHGAQRAADINRIAIDNRRKQLAQCLWLRARVEEHLSAGDALLVMGDFNDGPGLDTYEKLFGKSGVEIVMATEGPADRQMTDPHAQMVLSRKVGAAPTSSRFYDRIHRRYFGALLDFILVSPDLAALAPHWRIWHPMDDPLCWKTPALRDALMTASDHFPVTIDLILQRQGAGNAA